MSDERLTADLEAARENLRRVGYSDLTAWDAAYRKELAAERALAAAQGRQYAEVVDIGVEWDSGAPMPLLVSSGGRASVIFYSRTTDPVAAQTRGVIEFQRVASVRMGAPNDEAIEGHRLHGNGLRAYCAHEINNSEWLEEHMRVNSVHPRHSDEPWRRKHHYLLAFHDEIVECLAEEIRGWTTEATFEAAFSDLLRGVLGQGSLKAPVRRLGRDF